MRIVFLVASLLCGVWWLISVFTNQPTVEKIYPMLGMLGFYTMAKLEELSKEGE